jgi:hypothetical protein
LPHDTLQVLREGHQLVGLERGVVQQILSEANTGNDRAEVHAENSGSRAIRPPRSDVGITVTPSSSASEPRSPASSRASVVNSNSLQFAPLPELCELGMQVGAPDPSSRPAWAGPRVSSPPSGAP